MRHQCFLCFLIAYVKVALSSKYRFMAKILLYVAQIYALLHKQRRKRMTENMRRYIFCYACGLAVLADYITHTLRGQCASETVYKYMLALHPLLFQKILAKCQIMTVKFSQIAACQVTLAFLVTFSYEFYDPAFFVIIT